MENAPKIYGGTTEADPSREGVLQVQEERRLARAAYLELLSLGMPSTNWLFIGRDGAIQTLLDVLPLGALILTWRPGEPLVLPADDEDGTVLLRGIDGLAQDEQRYLMDWMESVGRARVVSTTSARLLPRVRAGAFIEMLYYRLNTICVDVTG